MRSKLVLTVRPIVERAFPALKDWKITVEGLDSDAADGALAEIQIRDKRRRVAVIGLSLTDTRKMSAKELTGLIVHELCHIEDDSQWPGCDCEPDCVHETLEERRTDAAVVAKGYGEELMALLDYHDAHYPAYDSSDGLTREEIETLMVQ